MVKHPLKGGTNQHLEPSKKPKTEYQIYPPGKIEKGRRKHRGVGPKGPPPPMYFISYWGINLNQNLDRHLIHELFCNDQETIQLAHQLLVHQAHY